VWYFGEEVDIYKNGKIVGHDGAWQAGAGGAVAGIMIPSSPLVGMKYRQEFLRDEAEDLGEIISLTETITVEFGTSSDVVKTNKRTPLEKFSEESKFYATGVGLIRTESLADPSFENLFSKSK